MVNLRQILLRMGFEMSEPDDNENENSGDDGTESPGLSGRRDAIKKVGLAAGVAGAAWAAPAINGTSVVPAVAGAQTTLPPIVVGDPTSGFCADKTAGCYSAGLGDDVFAADLGGGHWDFYFQGCSRFGLIPGSESVALSATGGHPLDAYEPPPGYKCRMTLHNGTSGAQIVDTGYVSNPINGIEDTGGVIFIFPAQFPDGQDKVCAVIQCDPI